MDFSVIERAGMTQQEFGALVGVSRVTANSWTRGRIAPHKFIRARIAALLEHLEDAIQHGALPISPEPTPMNKPALIQGAVRDAMARKAAA